MITRTQGVYLRFFVHENRRHHGILLYEWLLEQAKKQGIPGGSAFRAIAGFGRHGVLHEQQFFELADDLPVKVEFLLQPAQAEALLQLARDAGVAAVCASAPMRFAVLGPR